MIRNLTTTSSLPTKARSRITATGKGINESLGIGIRIRISVDLFLRIPLLGFVLLRIRRVLVRCKTTVTASSQLAFRAKIGLPVAFNYKLPFATEGVVRVRRKEEPLECASPARSCTSCNAPSANNLLLFLRCYKLRFPAAVAPSRCRCLRASGQSRQSPFCDPYRSRQTDADEDGPALAFCSEAASRCLHRPAIHRSLSHYFGQPMKVSLEIWTNQRIHAL